MVETFKASVENPKWMLAKKAITAESFENSLNKVKAIAYKEKIDWLLDKAKDVSSRWYIYSYPTMVCDSFLKKIFTEKWNPSLNDIYGTYSMYDKYKSVIEWNIKPAKNTFSFTWTPMAWDLLFFLDPKWWCPHVGMFVKNNKNNSIDIYDAIPWHVWYRTISPSEFSGKNVYTFLAFARPFTQ